MGNLLRTRLSETFAFIPARKGSKRVKHKNRLIVDDRPLFFHTGYNVITSGVQDVVISSDDERILEYDNLFTYSRRNKHTDDKSNLSQVLHNFLLENSEYTEKYRFVLLVLPTAFLIKLETFRDAMATFWANNKTKTLFSGCKYPHPIQRAFFKKNNFFDFKFKKNLFTRTQDLDEAYYDAGQFYVLNIKKFMKSKKIFDTFKTMYELNRFDFVDIDTVNDFEMAKKLYYIQKANGHSL